MRVSAGGVMSYEMMKSLASVAAAASSSVAEAVLKASNDANRPLAAVAFKEMADVVEPLVDATMREARRRPTSALARERAQLATKPLQTWMSAARALATALESGDTEAARTATEAYNRAYEKVVGG